MVLSGLVYFENARDGEGNDDLGRCNQNSDPNKRNVRRRIDGDSNEVR